jgi:glycosyltransferase involved in cell wall biosynthesis
MKVLHVITGLGNGGAEAVLYSLCKFDHENDHTVVSLMNDDKYGSLLEEIGVNVICLNLMPGSITLKAFIQLISTIKNTKPDLVQTWMLHSDFIGSVAAWIAGVRRVYWGVHHTLFDKSVSLRTKIIFRLNCLISYVIPTKIICCSNASLKHLMNSYYDSRKLVFVANGYDINLFKSDSNSIISSNSSEHEAYLPILCMVGRFHPLKDHENLFKALDIVNTKKYKFYFRCIGPGVDESNQYLSMLRSDFNLNSIIALEGSSENIPDVLRASDIFVLSSCGEAFPNVINEAMACEVPCVTTDVGDAAYIVGDTGWVAPPKNPELLADRIIDALNEFQNYELFQQRRKRARERIVNNFSIQKMVENYNRVWRIE